MTKTILAIETSCDETGVGIARLDADGELVLLDDQDRSLWDAGQIEEGRAVLDRALALRGRGPYVLQAAIASLHADEPRNLRPRTARRSCPRR